MPIRTARPDEIPALYTTGDSVRDADTAGYLTRLLDVGCVKADWCFVSETDGAVGGSIVLWTRPGHGTPTDFVLFDTDWDRTPEVGRALIDHAVEAAAGFGAEALAHVLDSPGQVPQHQSHAEVRHEALAGAGFAVTRDGRRWEWLAGDPVPEADDRLTWRDLSALGEEPFLELLAELLADTGDSLLRDAVNRLGLRGAAKEVWQGSLGMEHEDAWFELGFDADGTAAAISLPSRTPSAAVIGFVGVSPRHRGKGYAASIVARGTRILAAAGAETVRGDCDSANIAMVRGFERAGYRNFADRREYRKVL